MSKVAIFRDPIAETLEWKLSEVFDPAALQHDTTFTLQRAGASEVRAFIRAKGRAEGKDSAWHDWTMGEVEDAADLFQRLGTDGLAQLMASAVVLRVHTLPVENGDGKVALWDSDDHPKQDRIDTLEAFFNDFQDVLLACFAASLQAQQDYEEAYAKTLKNSLPSSGNSKRKTARRGKSAKPGSGK